MAEIRAVFADYEAALRGNDVEHLNNCFLDHADTVRCGVADLQRGADAIRRWRASAAPVHPQRRIGNTVIMTFGHDLATVYADFTAPDTTLNGRQTQTWVRTSSGWRIACAHVSLGPV